MGLHCSYKTFDGPYSKFDRFRDALAIAAGFELYEKEGGHYFGRFGLDYDNTYEEENVLGIWPVEPKEPLLLLLCHSDCEGVIQFRHLCLLAARIAELIPKIDAQWKVTAIEFARGLLRAYKFERDVKFS